MIVAIRRGVKSYGTKLIKIVHAHKFLSTDCPHLLRLLASAWYRGAIHKYSSQVIIYWYSRYIKYCRLNTHIHPNSTRFTILTPSGTTTSESNSWKNPENQWFSGFFAFSALCKIRQNEALRVGASVGLDSNVQKVQRLRSNPLIDLWLPAVFSSCQRTIV